MAFYAVFSPISIYFFKIFTFPKSLGGYCIGKNDRKNSLNVLTKSLKINKPSLQMQQT